MRHGRAPGKALAYWAEHARPRVDAFHAWVWEQRQRVDVLPSNALAKVLAKCPRTGGVAQAVGVNFQAEQPIKIYEMN